MSRGGAGEAGSTNRTDLNTERCSICMTVSELKSQINTLPHVRACCQSTRPTQHTLKHAGEADAFASTTLQFQHGDESYATAGFGRGECATILAECLEEQTQSRLEAQAIWGAVPARSQASKFGRAAAGGCYFYSKRSARYRQSQDTRGQVHNSVAKMKNAMPLDKTFALALDRS